MAYDEKCLGLAYHFLGSRIREELASELAQHIQDEVEIWLEYKKRSIEAALRKNPQ